MGDRFCPESEKNKHKLCKQNDFFLRMRVVNLHVFIVLQLPTTIIQLDIW